MIEPNVFAVTCLAAIFLGIGLMGAWDSFTNQSREEFILSGILIFIGLVIYFGTARLVP